MGNLLSDLVRQGREWNKLPDQRKKAREELNLPSPQAFNAIF